MISLRPPGSTMVGSQQGYLSLAVLIEKIEGYNCCVTHWEPTPDELARLNAGAPVRLICLGAQPPVKVEVGQASTENL